MQNSNRIILDNNKFSEKRKKLFSNSDNETETTTKKRFKNIFLLYFRITIVFIKKRKMKEDFFKKRVKRIKNWSLNLLSQNNLHRSSYKSKLSPIS